MSCDVVVILFTIKSLHIKILLSIFFLEISLKINANMAVISQYDYIIVILSIYINIMNQSN